MRSKASYFSLSFPIIKENFRRFWALPALSFLIYFLSGIFPILMSYRNINSMSYLINDILENRYFFYMALSLIIPVVAAVVVFKYMQQSASVTYMHSLPLSRARLFNSNLVSGLLMSLLPMLLTGLIMLIIAKPAYYLSWIEDGSLAENAVNLFTRSAICSWMWQGFIMILFVYAISVFAGMITGNSVIHLLASFFFLFLLPLMYLVLNIYFEQYLFGYYGLDSDLMMKLSAWMHALLGEGYTATLAAVYIAVSLLLIAVSAIFYQKRKMEKAGDAITVRFMIPVINYIIAFLGMTLMGFFFSALASEDFGPYFYAGLAAGTLIFFIIGRMLVLKTPRIFNKNSLISFGIYCLIAVIFIAALLLDITGYEKYIPKKPKQAYVSAFEFTGGSRFEASANSIFADDDNGFIFTEPDNIQAVTAFHKSIIDDANELRNYDWSKPYNATRAWVRFSYSKDPLSYEREYYLPYKYIAESPYLEQLFDSKEFRDYFSFNKIDAGKLSEIRLYGNGYNSSMLIPNTEFQGFLDAREKDFLEMTYEDFINDSEYYCNYNLYTEETLESSSDNRARYRSYYMDDNIRLSDKHTIAWLEEHGYSQSIIMELSPESIAYVEVYFQNGSEDANAYTYDSLTAPGAVVDYSGMPVGSHVIDDYSTIEDIFYNAQPNPYDYSNGYYVCRLVPTYDMIYLYAKNNSSEYGYDQELTEKLDQDAEFKNSLIDNWFDNLRFYDADSVPDYITELF